MEKEPKTVSRWCRYEMQPSVETFYRIAEVLKVEISELFNPLIHRIIGVLGRAGKLPDIPEELLKVDYKIEYLGKIALVLKALEVQGFVMTMEHLQSVIQNQGADGAIEVLREMLDNFELDKATRGIARANGVPATWIRNEEDVQQKRQDRGQQQNILSLVENVPGLAKALKDAGKAPEEGSLGKEMLNAA